MKWRADAVWIAILPALALAGCGAAEEAQKPRAERFAAAQAVKDVPVKIGTPYRAMGQSFTPADEPGYDAIGYASWYGDELRGNRTANGEPFNPDAISAAHPTLPLPSYVEITALENGRTILARINDRGPFSNDRLIDLSHGAARQLGISGDGHAPVRVRRVDPAEGEKLALRAGASVPNRAASAPDMMARLRARLNLDDGVANQRASADVPPGVPRYVQIAAFASRDRAEGMALRTGARVDRVGPVYRVRFGPFSTRSAANEALRSANAKGYPDARILPDSAQ